ncbi:PREDICTED: uncharacterized protein LOC104596268 [Nelumbo nucifera]|uniref:Uncharacterized protein LOC104596268 n=2 Tax=Nelumbo nucifera TaxID=4432 RepID=A0A1U7ZNG9_NELNU|nr:PREDICTED: uncharacterized protein LOC104596268 [Nelumbo nucifera]DAD18940.1 TPA_asm: hypothetical protein HUJ06_020403 [Nelumbo nucifera]
MSGGVGPTCGDISLPKEEEEHHLDVTAGKPQKKSAHRGFLRFRQLNALAVIIIFSASGMVSVQDFGFSLFCLLYVFFLSKFAFPSLSPSAEPPVFGEKNKLLFLYSFLGALIGLFLPIAYIFEGILEDDKKGIKASAPHVFLLSCQVFMEGLTSSGGFSVPIQVFVPVFYNTRRIFTIVDWLRSEIAKVDQEESGSTRRMYVGNGLAVANLAFWCFNLFGFVVPVYLPRAFKAYYGYKVKA